MKKLITVVGVLLVILLVVYFVAGYFLGNLPIASRMLGTNQPRDLGVELSVDNAYDGLSSLKHPTTTEDLQAIVDNPQVYTSVKATLTDDQASSLISTIDFPVKLVQIKFGPGGSVESSGVIHIAEFRALLEDTGASGETMNTVMDYISQVDWANYYISGQLGITDNRVSLDIDKLELGRISVPEGLRDQVNENMDFIERAISDALTNQGYDIRELSISEGNVNLDMDRPLGSIEPWLKYVQ